ncbi:MAG: sensor histidine kinase [Gammaproteobacteria bacterium]|nr:MAG: sensor histidine kinase [Gammaproteobacteria bacterium]
MAETEGARASTERFEIPELCSASALVAVVISAQLLTVVVVLLSGALSWVTFGVTSLFVQWVALVSAGTLCWLRPSLSRLPAAAGGACAWLLVTAVVALCALLAELALDGRLGQWVGAAVADPLLPASGPDWSMVLRTTLVGAILAGMLLRYLMVQQQLRDREQGALRLRVQALQSRIRPHFLFNSMNIIASLIETDPRTAELVVEDLSELFRASLNEAGNQVSLQEELDLCERYVRIEQLRLGRRLHVEWEVDAVPHGVRIPLLTIQPLLENAIYHGIQPLPEGGTVHVRLQIEGDRVNVEIDNPLPPPNAARRAVQGNRMALANIRSRLEVLYGSEATLAVHDSGERYRIRLSYPRNGSGKGEVGLKTGGDRRQG